jgi:protocatechuate 3,4-dioxygenase beta subunit
MNLSKLKLWAAGLLVLGLVGCGGGGGASGTPLGSTSGGNTGSSGAAKVELTSSNATLGDGSSTVTLTAVVKDANNAAVANAPVTWSFTAGSLAGAVLTTDAGGSATASFSATDRSSGVATITVTSGSAQGSTRIALQAPRQVVVDSAAKTLGVAIDGETATISATVKDLSNVAISGASVSWSTDVGTLRSISSVTDATGVATATFDAGSTLSLAAATVTVSSGGASGSVRIPINAASKTIELLADATSIGTGGDTTTLRAFVKNGVTNAALSGQAVTWSTSSGTLSGVTAVTNASGLATATLSAGANKTNRDAVVTAVSGSASQTLKMPINNTKLSYSGVTSAALGSTVTLSFTVVDSKGVAIPGINVGLVSKLGNGLPATTVTDAAGQANVSYVATTSGTDTITAVGANASLAVPLVISGSGEQLTFTDPVAGTQVPVGQSRTLSILYQKDGAPQKQKLLNLAATVGSLGASVVTTDDAGKATVTIQSALAGTSTVSATLAGGSVQGTLPVVFVATTPKTLVLQVSPSALAPNPTGSTAQQAAVYARVTDANGNPVPNMTVNFSQDADPSHGVLQQASAVTDASGQASVQYLSGPDSTASSAVILRGTVVGASPVVTGTATLTVNGEALFIVLGTGNDISNFDPQTYQKVWTVYVTDANGVRVANKQVTVKVIPTVYGKGCLVYSDSAQAWVYSTLSCSSRAAYPTTPLSCANEDLNQNGRLDSGEDTNSDGTLTPGNVVALTASTVTTDANGAASITMRYAELYASWIAVRLTASATVGGTESMTFKEFPLDKLGSDYSSKLIAPAGVISPFGIDTSSCSNAN